MGKKKNKERTIDTRVRSGQAFARKINTRDRLLFEHRPRSFDCLGHLYNQLVARPLDSEQIRDSLAFKCSTIEHQIVLLRDFILLNKEDLTKRYDFTRSLLDCLLRHHEVVYEGVMFGSSINGLGFRDSDVDLRLRPLKRIGRKFEPLRYDRDHVERTLRNIAWQTTRCLPALGEFVPSTRCPIAKLTFISGYLQKHETLHEMINYDISLSSDNSLGSFNSKYLKFLCELEPKFHLLATVVRYWSKMHNLIVSGFLSSYALVNMLIFFCQTLDEPLLPTVDQMRDVRLANEKRNVHPLKGLTQIEWHCLISLVPSDYSRSKNIEPLSVLLLKFFEFYLNFPYSNHVITVRPGRALKQDEFVSSPQYHPRFPMKDYLNIQDPFDLKHNLTSGMTGEHLRLFLITVRYSYEKLFRELTCNFIKPIELVSGNKISSRKNDNTTKKSIKLDSRDWGLNALFVSLTPDEINRSL